LFKTNRIKEQRASLTLRFTLIGTAPGVDCVLRHHPSKGVGEHQSCSDVPINRNR